MLCPNCSIELPSQARFCLNCGAPLGGIPQPGVRAADRFSLIKDYIPPELANKILTAGRKIESERRHVTILFADVTGFTTLAEQLDMEDLSTVLNDSFRGLIATILKYEGTIDKFIGDGIMAIFGAPLAHENDPERAVRCALEMMTDIERYNALSSTPLPAPLGLHVGLHSGMVIAGNVGSDLRMNYSVVGDTVNLAWRLVELAKTGEIFLSSDTYRLVSGIATVEGPISTAVKGKAEAVEIYKLKDITPEKDVLRSQSGDIFVGREGELAEIDRLLTGVVGRKRARLFIRGEAGVGKSRLKSEMLDLARAKNIASVEGKCSSFEVSSPYFMWNTLLKSILRLGIDASEGEARIRLHEMVQQFSLDEHEPYLATLLSLRYEQILMEEEHSRKRRIFDAVTKLMNAYSIRKPTVFVLEDLHWIDKFSQELLEYVLSRAGDVPGLIVCLYRDEYLFARQITHYGTVLDLNRLSDEDARKMIRFRLNVSSVPPILEHVVLTRSEGNPFYIQELLKTLIDKNIIAVTDGTLEVLSDNIEAGIPSTIQGIIMARIDRIQERVKDVLFSASVIGREFSRPLLERVLESKSNIEPHLNELQSLELILEKDEAREFAYLFKHYLIQEVAYNTILVNKRKELHSSIARAIETLYADRLVEFYELLAFHYEKAEEWEKAAEYLSRSGHKVRQIYSVDESKEFFDRKQVAIQNVFQAASAKWSVWATFKAITPPLIAMLIPILPIFMYILILSKRKSPDVVELLVVVSVATLLLLWYAFSLWYLGVIPFLRGRPKLYDLMEDQVRIIFRDGTNIAIHFSEIVSMRFFDPRKNSSRPFPYKLIDPLSRMSHYGQLTFGRWFREVVLNVLPPYSFGFGSKQGEIHIQLNSGYRALRVVIPWFNTPLKSKDMSLLPFAPGEFYQQLETAFERWRQGQLKPPSLNLHSQRQGTGARVNS